MVTWYLSLFLLIHCLPTERVFYFGFGMQKRQLEREATIAYFTLPHNRYPCQQCDFCHTAAPAPRSRIARIYGSKFSYKTYGVKIQKIGLALITAISLGLLTAGSGLMISWAKNEVIEVPGGDVEALYAAVYDEIGAQGTTLRSCWSREPSFWKKTAFWWPVGPRRQHDIA